uniref:Putative secreted protein n=1 Tax=Anopheles darlingi TaxID=43151 RepID=A0A2M4D284_ANODA
MVAIPGALLVVVVVVVVLVEVMALLANPRLAGTAYRTCGMCSLSPAMPWMVSSCSSINGRRSYWASCHRNCSVRACMSTITTRTYRHWPNHTRPPSKGRNASRPPSIGCARKSPAS